VNLTSLARGISRATYVDFHLLVDAIIHNQTVSKPDSMRLHRMTSDVGIISNIGVVEVCHSDLGVGGAAVRTNRVDRGERIRHDARRLRLSPTDRGLRLLLGD
jgi:hypothetical protein